LYNNSLANHQNLCPKWAPHTKTMAWMQRCSLADSGINKRLIRRHSFID